MKILLNSDGTSHSTESAVEFCQINKNSYVGVIQLRLPLQRDDGGAYSHVNAKVSITADSTVNAKGRSRLLFKASMPYTAFVQGMETYGSNLRYDVDPKRSGGEVAVHTVISVPKALRDDILGRNGSIEQSVSAAQLTLLGQLVTAFTKLIQPVGVTAEANKRARVSYDTALDEFTLAAPSTGKIPVTGFGCLGDGTAVAGTQVAQYSGEKDLNRATFENVLYLGHLTNSPIMRALNGLAPICDAEKYRTANLRSVEPSA